MSINVSQSFHRTSANPVDDTLTLTKAQMLTVNDNLMPNKYMTVCQDDGKIYVYDKTNTSDAETGKFRKYGEEAMPSEDMADVITPLPSARPAYHKYSTEEQIVGEWIDDRLIYEKVYTGTTPTVTTEGVEAQQIIPLGNISLRDVVHMRGLMISKTGTISYQMINMVYIYSTDQKFIQAYVNKTNNTIVINTNTSSYNDRDLVFIIQYTKAT